MNKLLFLLLTTFSIITAKAQNVGIGTTAPNSSAILELKATDKGLLIPRTSTTTRTAIVNPAKGLMVYDTTTSSFWFHNGSAWVQIQADGNGWSITGNAGTNPTTNFIGTTDAQPLTFKVENVRSGFIDTVSQNTGIGFRTLDSITNGTHNTAMGYKALISDNLGNQNTAIGSNALRKNTTGHYNTAIGMQSLTINIDGTSNVGIGTASLFSNTSGSNNAAIGTGSLFSNTTGNDNTSIGYQSLNVNSTGYSNVAIGVRALHVNTTASNLVAIGDSALFNNGTDAVNSNDAEQNTAIGSKALYANTTGNNNTAIGLNALSSITSGSSNTAIGANAGVFNSSFSNATAIGANAIAPASNSIQLGNNDVSNIYTNNNCDVWVGNLYAKGYGIVRNSSSLQLKMSSGSYVVSGNINALSTINIPFNFNETFSTLPVAYVGNITGGPGGFAEIIMSIANVTTTGFSLFVSNPRNTSVSPNFTVNVVAIGGE